VSEALRAELVGKVAALIARLAPEGAPRDDAARDALLAELLRFQRSHVVPYARIVQQSAVADAQPLAWPAVPTDVFRFLRVAVHGPEQDQRVFHTSGTTQQARGAHHVRDLALYDASAEANARRLLFPDLSRMRLVVLAPRSSVAPDSSLAYMLQRFESWFGAGASTYVWQGDAAHGAIDTEQLARTLEAAERDGVRVALLGTSFAYVHADDTLGTRRFLLPPGSRVMQTGGFKGRSREIEPAAMRTMIEQRYGVPESCVIAEYGMTELCSQLYEQTLREDRLGLPATPRRLVAPPWVRVSIVDPETLQPVAHGREGLVRIDDLANVDTACAIQTSDRGIASEDGIVVLGRASGAVPRGCSIAVDAALAKDERA
jgi:hypothetical protein